MELVRRAVSLSKGRPLAAATLLAAALRLPWLAVESFWYDETFTAWLAGLPLSRLIDATMGDVHPPTWYLIEWGMVRLFGSSEFSLRLVSALAGIALVPAVYHLATALGLTRRQQITAALVTSLAPFAIYYSHEARPYSLLMLACTLATYATLKRRWWLLFVAAVAALYLHNLAALYVAALGWLALYRYRFTAPVIATFSAIALAWLPWLLLGLLAQTADVSNGFWVRPPTYGTPAYILTSLLFGQAGFIALNAGLLAGLLLLLARWDWPMAGLVFMPLALAVIVSVVWRPVLIVRVMAPIAPVMFVLVATALDRRPLLAGLALFTVAVWFTAYMVHAEVGRPPAFYHFDALAANLRPGDGIFHGNLASYISLHYYLPDVDHVVWRQANDLSQSLTDQTKIAMQMNQASFEAVKCRHDRWWIITASNPTTAPAERQYLTDLLAANNGQQVDIIQQSDLLDARLWLVEPACGEMAAHE